MNPEIMVRQKGHRGGRFWYRHRVIPHPAHMRWWQPTIAMSTCLHRHIPQVLKSSAPLMLRLMAGGGQTAGALGLSRSRWSRDREMARTGIMASRPLHRQTSHVRRYDTIALSLQPHLSCQPYHSENSVTDATGIVGEATTTCWLPEGPTLESVLRKRAHSRPHQSALPPCTLRFCST